MSDTYGYFTAFALLVAMIILVAGKVAERQQPTMPPAEQIRLCAWYYDICHDSDTNPKHEVWTDKGKAMLTEWVRVKFPVKLIDDLPGEIGEWVRRVKG